MSKARELSQRAGVDGALSNRNKVINGSFLVWQRSESAYTNSGYASVDRFMATRGRIRKPNTSGYTGEDNTGAVFDCLDGGVYSHFDYYIEDIGQKLHGKTMTLSFKMKSLTGSSESLYLDQTGTNAFDFGGSTTITVPTEWTTFTFTGTVVSTGYVGGVHLMRWYLNPTGSSAVSKRLQIDEVQFEEGDTATPFEHRSYGQELALCQRYTTVFNDSVGIWGIGRWETSAVYVDCTLPVQLRTFPTVTMPSNNGVYAVDPTVAWYQVQNFVGISTNSVIKPSLSFNMGGAYAANKTYTTLGMYSNSGAGQLIFDAELYG